MIPFTKEAGQIAAMLAPNIDTDVIMPKQFLKGIDRLGLDRGVFFDQRFLSDGSPNPDFVLNQDPWDTAIFLAVGPNFGCGSSREHAVWGLLQLGIRAIIGTSFAGIFSDNCRRNGLLLIEMGAAEFLSISTMSENPVAPAISIDLPNQLISAPGLADQAFDIDADLKADLLAGKDAISKTLSYAAEISAFENRHMRDNPWLATTSV